MLLRPLRSGVQSAAPGRRVDVLPALTDVTHHLAEHLSQCLTTTDSAKSQMLYFPPFLVSPEFWKNGTALKDHQSHTFLKDM